MKWSLKSGFFPSAVIVYTLFTFTTIASSGTYSGGSGMAEDPYKIGTATDLIALGNTPADYDKHFILTTDIDLSGYVFSQAPIAPDTNIASSDFQGISFSGSFDGGGHTLFNLQISSSQDYIGLFGCVGSGGKIRNLGIEQVNITGKSFSGGLVGYNYGTIENCFATGAVRGTAYVGGLVGLNDKGAITSCYATGAVSGTIFFGGLLGMNYYGTITACYATGTLSGGGYVGGLVGMNDGTITTCCATGNVSGTGNVGGLVGCSRAWGERCERKCHYVNCIYICHHYCPVIS